MAGGQISCRRQRVAGRVQEYKICKNFVDDDTEGNGWNDSVSKHNCRGLKVLIESCCSWLFPYTVIDPMQKWPPLIFVTEKNYLLTEIYYFTVKIRSKGITV